MKAKKQKEKEVCVVCGRLKSHKVHKQDHFFSPDFPEWTEAEYADYLSNM